MLRYLEVGLREVISSHRKRLYERNQCPYKRGVGKMILSHMRLWWKYDHLKTEVGVSQWIVLNSWTSRFQNFENINFCCLSHPVYDILLWQPKLTKIQNKIVFFSYFHLTFTPHNLPNMTVPLCGDIFLTFPTNTFATPSLRSPLLPTLNDIAHM